LWDILFYTFLANDHICTVVRKRNCCKGDLSTAHPDFWTPSDRKPLNRLTLNLIGVITSGISPHMQTLAPWCANMNQPTEHRPTFNTCNSSLAHGLQIINTAARLVRAHGIFEHHGVNHNDFCWFKGVTYVALYTDKCFTVNILMAFC